MRKVTMYGGRIAGSFDPEEHCYSFSVNEKPPLPAAGVTSILKEALGTSTAIANWMVNQTHDHIVDSVSFFMQLGLNFDGMEQEYIRIPRKEFEKICKTAKTAHRKTSKKATDIGSLVHKFAEMSLKNETVMMPADPLAKNAAEAFIQWKEYAKLGIVDLERIVFSETWWYAGTCDYYGTVDGKLSVLDLKTSSGLYREMPLQLAAYAVALEEETGDKIEDGWIIKLDKHTGNPEAHHIPLTKRLKDDWLLVRGTHRALQRIEDLIKEVRSSCQGWG